MHIITDFRCTSLHKAKATWLRTTDVWRCRVFTEITACIFRKLQRATTWCLFSSRHNAGLPGCWEPHRSLLPPSKFHRAVINLAIFHPRDFSAATWLCCNFFYIYNCIKPFISEAPPAVVSQPSNRRSEVSPVPRQLAAPRHSAAALRRDPGGCGAGAGAAPASPHRGSWNGLNRVFLHHVSVLPRETRRACLV